MSPPKFEWHLNFLFLALDTNLRKSPSCWWRCFVLCYSCKCSNSSWNFCSPLKSPCSCDGYIAICVLTGHFSDSLQPSEIFFPFIYASVYITVGSLAFWLWHFLRRLLPPFTLISHAELCTLKICSQTGEKFHWINLLEQSAGHAACDCLPDGGATNFVQ